MRTMHLTLCLSLAPMMAVAQDRTNHHRTVLDLECVAPSAERLLANDYRALKERVATADKSCSRPLRVIRPSGSNAKANPAATLNKPAAPTNWSAPTVLDAFDLPENVNVIDLRWPHPGMDGDGNSLIVWYASGGIYSGRYDAVDAQWEATTLVTDEGGRPELAMSDDGSAFLVFNRYESYPWGESDEVWLNRFDPSIESWGVPIFGDEHGLHKRPVMTDDGDASIFWWQAIDSDPNLAGIDFSADPATLSNVNIHNPGYVGYFSATTDGFSSMTLGWVYDDHVGFRERDLATGVWSAAQTLPAQPNETVWTPPDLESNFWRRSWLNRRRWWQFGDGAGGGLF